MSGPANTKPTEPLASLPPATELWLLRIPAVFAGLAGTNAAGLTAMPVRRLGTDYHLARVADAPAMRALPGFRLVSWNLPVHHAWPCCPPRIDGFIEKAAQAVAGKFAPFRPQAAWAGPLPAGATGSYYRRLASNLRGRLLQLLPGLTEKDDPEQQDPSVSSLFCMVGVEGLYCGVSTPREANGFYPGGTRYVRHGGGFAVSRAGAKLAEALHYLRLHREWPATGARWLELGASPGGMTSELLDRGYQVTALDRAPLDPRLAGRPGLTFHRVDAGDWSPPAGMAHDALLCDMNGDAGASLEQVTRLVRHLRPGALVVFTLKLGAAGTLAEIDRLHRQIEAQAAAGGLRRFATTHLTYNRHEFTVFFER